MNYYKISITSPSDKQDLLIALLSDSGFDGFEQEDYGIKTYCEESELKKYQLEALSKKLGFTYKTKLIPAKNWNKVWESNFNPIQIHDFCGIRADFHPPFDGVDHEIIINPKMAFGTGHHESTFLVMEMMRYMDFTQKEVLDYGCGTGILAILASRLGAKRVEAIDNDPLAVENSKENIEKNNVAGIITQLGSINDTLSNNFDLILANINRNVILDSLPSLFSKTRTGGSVLISGFILDDQPLLATKAEEIGFSVVEAREKEEWICMKLEKS